MMNCGMQSERYKVLYYKTCKAYTKKEFDKLMSDIQAVRPDAHHKLVEARIDKWCREKSPANRHYMTSNSAKSVNALTKEVRKIPITALMEWYRDRLRKWYYERRVKHKDSQDEELTPWACAKIRVEGLTNVNNLAKLWFLNSTIKATYEGIIYLVKDIPTWHTPNDLQVVLPPVMGNKLPGRPKNIDRIRSQGEGPILTRCGRCGAMDHNRTTSNVPLPSVQNISIRIDGMHESSNPRDNFMNASHEEENHEVYQQGMYEP
nr:hypothetical protein [Tanacetum cinerariifolium]